MLPGLAGDPPSEALQRIRNLATQLARDQAVKAIQELHDQRHALLPEAMARWRDYTLRQLKGLSPGKSAALTATTSRDGTVVTNSEDIATALRKHWQPIFARRTLVAELLATWLAEDTADPGGLRSAIQPLLSPAGECKDRRRDVHRAVDLVGSSARGPGGIPCTAWKRLGSLAVDSLWGALKVLESDDGLEALAAASPQMPTRTTTGTVR
jgi:hypothetical protein